MLSILHIMSCRSISDTVKNTTEKSLRALALPETPHAGGSTRLVRARAGGVHRGLRCARVKVATGAARDACMENVGKFLSGGVCPE